jgi:hypothetical protein
VKQTLHNLAKQADQAKAEQVAQDEMKKAKDLFDTAAKSANEPVKHTIKLEAVK